MSSNAEFIKILNGYIQYIDHHRSSITGGWNQSDSEFIGKVREVIAGVFTKNEKNEFIQLTQQRADSNHVKGSANASSYLQKLIIKL